MVLRHVSLLEILLNYSVTLEDVAVLGECCVVSWDSSLNILVVILFLMLYRSTRST